jgi:predicted dehydrogenase
MVGIGIIGTGFGARVHLPGFLKVRGAEVVGVASRRVDRARECTGKFGIRCFERWEELVASPDVQAVSIATPPASHAEMVLAVVEAKKAVLCEKPLAVSLEQARHMCARAREAGVVRMVDFEFRELPAFQEARRILQARELGKIRQVHWKLIVGSWADPRREWWWQSDHSQGGGVVASHAVHLFDAIEWLFGKVVKLVALLATAIPERLDARGTLRPVTAEDSATLLLVLEDGTPVTVTLSLCAPRGTGHWIEVQGERRTLLVGTDEVADYGKGFRIFLGELGAREFREIPLTVLEGQEGEDGRIPLFTQLAQRFIDAVQEGRTDVQPSFAEGLRAQELIEAAYRSHAERRWVELPLL